jgi:hypothetical protein
MKAIAVRAHPSFELLANQSLSTIREERESIPNVRDWKVAVSPSANRCTCTACNAVYAFLNDGMEDEARFRGPEHAYKGHTTCQLINWAA